MPTATAGPYSASAQQLLGLIDAVDNAFPALNADGTTANAAARDAAIKGLADDTFTSGLIVVPPSVTEAMFESLVNGLVTVVSTYKAATSRPSLPI